MEEKPIVLTFTKQDGKVYNIIISEVTASAIALLLYPKLETKEHVRDFNKLYNFLKEK